MLNDSKKELILDKKCLTDLIKLTCCTWTVLPAKHSALSGFPEPAPRARESSCSTDATGSYLCDLWWLLAPRLCTLLPVWKILSFQIAEYSLLIMARVTAVVRVYSASFTFARPKSKRGFCGGRVDPRMRCTRVSANWNAFGLIWSLFLLHNVQCSLNIILFIVIRWLSTISLLVVWF